MAQPLTFIFCGPSGSGKGTQVELLKAHLKKETPDIPQFHSYTGDKIRAFMDGPTLAAHIAKEIQEAGKLQPEFLAIYLWAENFVKNLKGGEHILIDGSPRKPAEAVVLDSALQFFKRDSVYLFDIHISPEESKRRLLLRARHDDHTEKIARRLSWYATEVLPAIEYLRKQSGYHYHRINGEQAPEAVFSEILTAIK